MPVSFWSSPTLPAIAALLALSPTPQLVAQDATLTVLGFRAPVPATWQSRQPSSSMRLAEYMVSGEGSTVEVVVYFFGTGQGGSADANIERWRSQFSAPAGESVFEKIERDSAGTFPMTLAEWRGTYARGIGTGSAAGDSRPGHTLVAAIVDTPRGTLFFQLFGPSAQVVKARPGFQQVVRALKPPA